MLHGCCCRCWPAALGGNLGGVTSWLLGLDGGQLAAQLHADVLIPVLGYKRCLDAENGYGECMRAAGAALTTARRLQPAMQQRRNTG
jgi:hypothetical protein